MNVELINKIELLKQNYAFEIEEIDISNNAVAACAGIYHAAEGYYIADNKANKIHKLDAHMMYACSLDIDVCPGSIVDDGHGTLYISDARKRIVLTYAPHKKLLSNISKGADIQWPLLMAGNTAGDLFVSDVNRVWHYRAGQWRSIIEIEGLYIRYLAILDDQICIYDGNSHQLYVYNQKGEYIAHTVFTEIPMPRNPAVGFEIDPRTTSYYVSQGNCICKYNQKGTLIFTKSLTDYISSRSITRLLLSSRDNKNCLYLIAPPMRRILKAII